MSNLLYLAHRIPFPPNKGDKIRSYHFLRHLSKNHTVYLGAFVDDADDWRHADTLRGLCAEVFLRPIGGWRSKLAAITSLSRRRSLSVAYYEDIAMRGWITQILRTVDFDVVMAFSSTMAQYFPASNASSAYRVADFVDLDSDKWRQYADSKKWPMSLVYSYEAVALARWEQAVLGRADSVILVSKAERDLMAGAIDADISKIRVLPNGVDLDYFDPSEDYECPYTGNPPVVVFTGAMDYFANEEGVCWFASAVWPYVRTGAKDAEFWIVGSNPTGNVKDLSAIPGVRVTGGVPDVRPYLKFADVAVAPLRLARGVQNKVLEALAMNLPVVAAPQALQGIEKNLPASSVRPASKEEEFARSVLGFFLRDRSNGAEEGREFIRKNFSWDSSLSRLDDLISAWSSGGSASR